MPGDSHKTPSALGGVRLIDLSRGIAGSLAAMLLGDLGADVLRLEVPEGDPLADDPGYLCWNRNKTIATVDLTCYAGLRETRRVVGLADVVIVDRSRDALEGLRLDGDSVLGAQPGVVHVWLPAYGEVGAWSGLAPDPVLLAAVSGVADLHNASEDRPVVPVSPVLAYEQGVLAAAAALAGLVERQRTGWGRSVVVSGLHAVAAMLAAVLVDAEGAIRPSKAPASPLPNYRHYLCADGQWIYLAALTQPFFLSALEVLDLVDAMVMPGVDGEFTNLLIPSIAEPVVERVAARFAEQPREYWLAALTAAGVPNAPVDTREGWLASETVSATQLRLALQHPTLGTVELPGIAIGLSETPGRVRSLPDLERRMPSDSYWTTVQPGPAATAPAEPPDPPGQRRLPLQSLRVLDLSTFVAGTFGPSLMATLGADVVKVEGLGGDPYRMFGLSFRAFNQAKRAIAIDLKRPEGFDALLELVKKADVVVDNLRPGPRARLGLHPAALRAVNPRVVCCSVTGFGEHGPLADTPGFDPLMQARSGLMTAQGGDDAPVFSVMLVHDILTGTLAAVGTLAALYYRGRTGRPQDVRVSLASSAMIAQSGEFVRYQGRPPVTVGGRDWAGPTSTHRLFRCRDGWVAVAATDERQTHALLSAIGVTHDPPDTVTPSDDAVAAMLETAFRGLSVDEALDRLFCAGVDAARVLSRHDIFADPWLAANGMFHHVPDRAFGGCTVVSGYSTWRGSPRPKVDFGAAVGQDTRAVLREAGLSDEKVDQLIASGAARDAELHREVAS